MEPYRLIQQVFVHDGPVRSICHGLTENEIVTGCQSDSPHVKRWKLSSDLLTMEEIGSPIFHDHWVTALTSLKPSASNPSVLLEVDLSFVLLSFLLALPFFRVVSSPVVWIIKFVSLITIIS
jgi:hypothetical protein